ncbi:hypothetical protein AALP_AA3G275300 [Arabis alpina]|uniref:Uncharacterized protein n=1 Tax=Arabis alpina TaxID=50452 RepID=A0A087HC28_ARAAL|nr:hypothetical protein AALP_AA3G275300 [Arabis alpina]
MHLVVKHLEFIYPLWDDDNENVKLNNMNRDILGGCLDEEVWELQPPVSKKKKSMAEVEEKKSKKSKSKVVEDSEDEDDSPICKKKKTKNSKANIEESEDEDDSPVEKKKKSKVVLVEESEDEDSEEECDMDIPLKNTPKLKKKKQQTEIPSGEGAAKKTKEGHSGEVLKLLKGLVGTIKKFETRLTFLEGKGNASKVVVDEQSKTGVGGAASVEDDMSWMKQEVTSKKTKFSVNRVIRKPDVKAKPTVLRKVKCEHVAPVQKGEAENLCKSNGEKKTKGVTGKEKEATPAKMNDGVECVEIFDLQ